MTGLEYSHRGLEVPGGEVEYRAPDGDEDTTFEVRMPIATTGEVRNKGDDPLTRDELEGMARQVNERSLGVFLDHGSTNLGGPTRYSAVGKLGEWREAEVEGERAADGADALVATAEFMDPESLPAATGQLRENLAALKEQVKRDMSLAASIGWREDESSPGGNDLMEASIVGIGADPRTTSDSENAALVARAAVEAGADKDALLDQIRAALEGGGTDAEHDSVTDNDSTGNSEAGTTQEEQDAQDSDEEFREFMREQQEQQTELLRTLTESLREDGMDDDEDEDEDEEEEQEMEEDEEDDEEDEEQSASPDDEQDADDSELAERIAELEDELAAVRSGEESVETPDADPEEEQSETEATTTATSETWGRHRN